MSKIVIASLALVLLVACPKGPVGPEPPWCGDESNPCPPNDPSYAEDLEADGRESLGGRACRNLRALGCSEGFKDPRTQRTCYNRLRSEETLVEIPFECVAHAKSVEAARACGTKDTLRFRCRNYSSDGGAQ